MSVYCFVHEGKLIAKITAATQSDAEWEFRSSFPKLRDEKYEVILKGKIRKEFRRKKRTRY